MKDFIIENLYGSSEISFEHIFIVLVVSMLISAIIYVVYYYKSRKYFFSQEFAVSLIALSMITSSIIIAVQSSLVISLGMVGALSIVRFRTAIKNALDLVFLFWSISVGIICASGLYVLALTLTLLLSVVILSIDGIPKVKMSKILVLDGEYPCSFSVLEKILKEQTRFFNVRNENIHNDKFNLIIECKGIKDQEKLISELMKTGIFNDVSILIQEGILD